LVSRTSTRAPESAATSTQLLLLPLWRDVRQATATSTQAPLLPQAGQVIALPARKIDRPHREFLEWHLDEVFKAS